jgi:hypothetical protein
LNFKIFRRSTQQWIIVSPPHSVVVPPRPEYAIPEILQSIAALIDGDGCIVLTGRNHSDFSYDEKEVRFNCSAANVIGKGGGALPPAEHF